MPEFQTPADIGNRALQALGAQMMDPTLGFTDGSNNANQISFCYGKLRQAELEDNIWEFATRRAALRAVDTNTMLLGPTLWQSGVTYFVGSIVADVTGTLWESIIRNNLGNQPQISPSAWVAYFGPVTAEPFDSSLGYFTGEIIYTLSGAGTFNIYKSLMNGNAVHPALPDQWAANTIFKIDDVVQVWPAWAVGTSYSKGQTVSYTDGNIYSSLINSNLGNIPPSSGADWALMPVLTLTSQLMPTSQFTAPIQILTTPVDEWQIATSYSIGTFVLYTGLLYVSIANSNLGNYPNASGSTSWVACSGGTLYQSLIDGNQNNNPANTPANWSSLTSYSIGNVVAATDGYNYTSKTNSNLNHNPANNADTTDWTQGPLTAWTTTFTLGGGNSLWIQIGGALFPNGVNLTALQITYPIGCGPLSQSWTKNIYHLPAGYLKKAPQDPKAGIWSWLGAPGNLTATDWTFEDSYIVTWESRAIVLRFVADVQDVTTFKKMFCEALACRIALEVCETVTQSTAKLQMIAQKYRQFRTRAVAANLIEVGPVTPPLDDFLACRV